MRILAVLVLLLIAPVLVTAQGDLPVWCPLDAAETAPVPEATLTTIDMPEWGFAATGKLSDDSARLAFTQGVGDAPLELWVVNADGSDLRPLLTLENLVTMRDLQPRLLPGIYRYEWVPGTHNLLVNSGDFVFGDAGGIFEFVADDLWLIDTDNGAMREILPRGEGGEMLFSPNGQWVVVQRRDGLTLVSADGQTIREDVLPGYSAPGMGHLPYYPPIVWEDADSFLTLTTTDPYVQSQAEAQTTIWRVPMEGEPEALRIVPAAFISAMLSPDGTFMAYWSTSAEGSNLRKVYLLYLLPLPGGEEELVLEGEGIDLLGWEPDSRHFRYRLQPDRETLLWGVCDTPITPN